MFIGLDESALSSSFIAWIAGYDSVSSLASSRGVSLSVVYGRPCASSMAYVIAKDVTATGAVTTGLEPGAPAPLTKAASTLPWASWVRASGSPIWMCLNRKSLLLRQKCGAHWVVAWVSSSEP